MHARLTGHLLWPSGGPGALYLSVCHSKHSHPDEFKCYNYPGVPEADKDFCYKVLRFPFLKNQNFLIVTEKKVTVPSFGVNIMSILIYNLQVIFLWANILTNNKNGLGAWTLETDCLG